MKRHSYTFPTELDTLIREIAKEKDWKLCKVIEKAVKCYLEKNPLPKKEQETT